MTTRQALTVLALLGALLLPAWAHNEPTVGLTFQDPPGWKASHSGGEQRYEVNPNDPEGWAMITLRTTELGEVESLSREQILEVTRKLASGLQDFALLGSKATTVGGVPGHLLSYTGTSGKIRLQATQVFAVRTGRLVALTVFSPPASHAARRQVFDKMLATVRWSDPR